MRSGLPFLLSSSPFIQIIVISTPWPISQKTGRPLFLEGGIAQNEEALHRTPRVELRHAWPHEADIEIGGTRTLVRVQEFQTSSYVL
jgi:hypothetical protein